jgi:hypothetical protein
MADHFNPKKATRSFWQRLKQLGEIISANPDLINDQAAWYQYCQQHQVPPDLYRLVDFLPLLEVSLKEETRPEEEKEEEKPEQPHRRTHGGLPEDDKEDDKAAMEDYNALQMGAEFDITDPKQKERYLKAVKYGEKIEREEKIKKEKWETEKAKERAAAEKTTQIKPPPAQIRGALITEAQKAAFREAIRQDLAQPSLPPSVPFPQRRHLPSFPSPQRQGGPISRGLDLFRPRGGMAGMGGLGGRAGSGIGNAVNAARSAAKMMMNLGRLAGMLGTPAGLPLMAIFVVVGIFIVVFLIIMSQGGISFGIPSSTSQVAGPNQINSSCTFTRSGVSAAYRSNILLNYFQEASAISGVPASILAAIARVETPSAVNYTDDDIASPPCPSSSTGALGLMQLQPPGTEGYYADGIELGASYLGTTASQLTRNDFCDVRKNIIIASGFIIKKTNAMLKTSGNTWNSAWEQDKLVIDKLATGYYGCLNYGGLKDCTGPFSYGDDVWNGLKNCQTVVAARGGSGLSGVGRSGIVQAASDIASRLYRNVENLYNGNYDKPNVYYYCTYLISDSYNKVGLTDLNWSAHGAVVNMMAYFENTGANGGKYRVLSRDVSANELQPGDVVFLIGANHQHVTLIKDVRIDPASGDGVIYTYESNGAVIEDVISVRNNRVLNARNTSYPIVGFGQPLGL